VIGLSVDHLLLPQFLECTTKPATCLASRHRPQLTGQFPDTVEHASELVENCPFPALVRNEIACAIEFSSLAFAKPDGGTVLAKPAPASFSVECFLPRTPAVILLFPSVLLMLFQCALGGFAESICPFLC
jgi:hypothetical protein